MSSGRVCVRRLFVLRSVASCEAFVLCWFVWRQIARRHTDAQRASDGLRTGLPTDFRLHGAQRSVPFHSSVATRPEMRIYFGLNLIHGDRQFKIMVRTKSYLTGRQLRQLFSKSQI